MSVLPPVIVWFREDLRISDNPALAAAADTGAAVICLYIRETGLAGARPLGGAARWWLNQSLQALSASLEGLGGRLVLKTGNAMEVLSALVNETGAKSVFWTRRYGEAEKTADAAVKAALKETGINVQSFNGRLLMEPWALKTGSGGYYRVFTPFWRAMQSAYSAPPALPAPKRLGRIEAAGETLAGWDLHPRGPDWSGGLADAW